jgi:hypothetical protein
LRAVATSFSSKIHGANRHRGNAFAATRETKALGCCRFDIDAIGLEAQNFGYACLHRRPVWANPGLFTDDGQIEIVNLAALLAHQGTGMGQKDRGIGILPLILTGREIGPDIAAANRP